MESFDLDKLAMKAKNDVKSFNKLFYALEDTIDAIAKDYAKGCNESHLNDYKSEAYFGLVKCLESYDSKAGAFISYAKYSMKQHILDYMRNKQNVINVGTTKLNEIKKVNKAIAYINKHNLEETEENIMKYSGINSKKTLETVLLAKKMKKYYSLSDFSKDDENNDSYCYDFISSKENVVEREFFENEEIKMLYSCISSLPLKDKFIAINSFGLYGKEVMSNKEIASKLHVSENTVINRKNSIKAALKEKMQPWVA